MDCSHSSHALFWQDRMRILITYHIMPYYTIPYKSRELPLQNQEKIVFGKMFLKKFIVYMIKPLNFGIF